MTSENGIRNGMSFSQPAQTSKGHGHATHSVQVRQFFFVRVRLQLLAFFFTDARGSSSSFSQPAQTSFDADSLPGHGSSSFEVSRDNISAGSVPEYQSSPDTKEPQTKRPKVEKNWIKIQEFLNSTDAEQFIIQECCWSKDTEFRQKYYSGAYLLYDAKTPTVTMYKSGNDHSCDKDDNASERVPMTAATKEFIENAFKDGARERKEVQTKLIAAKIDLPSKNQLNNFLAYIFETNILVRLYLVSVSYRNSAFNTHRYQKIQMNRTSSIILLMTKVMVTFGALYRRVICSKMQLIEKF